MTILGEFVTSRRHLSTHVTRTLHRTKGRVHHGHGCAPGQWTAEIARGQLPLPGLRAPGAGGGRQGKGDRGRETGKGTGEGGADTPHLGTNDRGAPAVDYIFPMLSGFEK